MAEDKPHPTGISAEDGKAVAKFMQDQREAAERAKAPKREERPEDLPDIVAKIVEEGREAKPEAPAKEEKKGLFGRLRRG